MALSNRSLRGDLILAGLVLAALSGCGDPERPKGPALPYTPDPAMKEWTETDIKLKDDLPKVLLKTTQGDIEITLFEDEAPNTVANFIGLVEKKFYDGLAFHRIIPNFCVQGGDPKGDGSGGPGYRLPPEFADTYHKNEYGTVATAKSPVFREMSGSQFFFNIRKDPKGNADLDGKYVVFGKVNKPGMEVVEKLAAVKLNGEKPVEPQKILSASVLSKRNHAYDVKSKVPEEEPKDESKSEAKTEQKSESKTEAKSGEKTAEKTGAKSSETEAKTSSMPAKETEKSK